jgi:hypothetical protein
MSRFTNNLSDPKLKFFRNLLQNPAWDAHGKLKYLLARDSDPTACVVAGVPPQTAERALRLFCDAFDIPDEQVFCLRPSDLIHDIYLAMVVPPGDDMEYERLAGNVEEAMGRALSDDEFKSFVTIEDLIRFVHEKVVDS